MQEFKNMMIRCMQEDCLKVSDINSICGVFERYAKMSDLDIIHIYDKYFGLDAQEDDDFLCAND